jgi:excinuclease ABC subunit C
VRLPLERPLPLLEGREQFAWSALCLPPRPRREVRIDREPAAMRKTVRECCPKSAGIYGFFDRTGELIYVGYSARLRNRLLTYFQAGQSVRKEHRVSRRASSLIWEDVGHPFVAMHRELEIIQKFGPRLNVRGRRGRNNVGFLCLTVEPAPRFALRSQLPRGVRHWWGPFSLDRSLRNAVDKLNQVFLLPDCPSSTSVAFTDDCWLFPLVRDSACLRAGTGSCLAPCDGSCPRDRYFLQLRTAREFLDGKSKQVLLDLNKQMGAAAADRHFEQASRLRDRGQSLADLQQRLQATRKPGIENGVYQIRVQGRRAWMLLAGGEVRGSVAEPLSRIRRKRFLELLDGLLDGEAHHEVAPERSSRLAAQTVALWFRQHPNELEKIVPVSAARENFLLPPAADVMRLPR